MVINCTRQRQVQLCDSQVLYEKTCYWLLTINLAKLTVHYNKYEYVWDSKVYGIQVYSIHCTKLLLLTSHWPISELLHIFHSLQYNLQHYLSFISLLLMELNYGLLYSHMINIYHCKSRLVIFTTDLLTWLHGLMWYQRIIL